MNTSDACNMNNALTTEADIPGASLGNRDPEKFKIAELRFWLRCRDASGLSNLKTKANYIRQ